MEPKLFTLAMLTLGAGVVSVAGAQKPASRGDHGSQPGSELIAWTQTLQTSPAPLPQPLQQVEHRDAPGLDQQPASVQQDDTQQQHATQTFAGTIMKSGCQYVLRTPDNVTYMLDDQERAKKYEGKQVQISGSLDESGGTIHLKDMISAA